MTDLPNAVWISFNGTLVKAAPERVRHATPEEDLTISGWLRGISRARVEFEQVPKKGFVDITADQDPLEDPEGDLPMDEQAPPRRDLQPLPMPERRVRRKQHPGEPHIDREGDPDSRQVGPVEPPDEPPGVGPHNPSQLRPQSPLEVVPELPPEQPRPPQAPSLPSGESMAVEPPGKRSRVQLLEVYHLHLQALAKQRAKKEARASDFQGRDAIKLQNAILKEINNNLRTKAYKLLSPEESRQIRLEKPEKIMESRYVLTKKPLETCEIPTARMEGVLLEDTTAGTCKAKARHVMKGYSEESALDVEFTTPQVNRDSVIFVLK